MMSLESLFCRLTSFLIKHNVAIAESRIIAVFLFVEGNSGAILPYKNFMGRLKPYSAMRTSASHNDNVIESVTRASLFCETFCSDGMALSCQVRRYQPYGAINHWKCSLDFYFSFKLMAVCYHFRHRNSVCTVTILSPIVACPILRSRCQLHTL